MTCHIRGLDDIGTQLNSDIFSAVAKWAVTS